MRTTEPLLHDDRHCRNCGAELRDPTTSRCGECGYPYNVGPCPVCGGGGQQRIIPPVWVCLAAVGVAGLLFLLFALLGWMRSRDIFTWLLPGMLGLFGIVANLTGHVRTTCQRCRGTGRARRRQ